MIDISKNENVFSFFLFSFCETTLLQLDHHFGTFVSFFFCHFASFLYMQSIVINISHLKMHHRPIAHAFKCIIFNEFLLLFVQETVAFFLFHSLYLSGAMKKMNNVKRTCVQLVFDRIEIDERMFVSHYFASVANVLFILENLLVEWDSSTLTLLGNVFLWLCIFFRFLK